MKDAGRGRGLLQLGPGDKDKVTREGSRVAVCQNPIPT